MHYTALYQYNTLQRLTSIGIVLYIALLLAWVLISGIQRLIDGPGQATP